jgi:hypothetical protein
MTVSKNKIRALEEIIVIGFFIVAISLPLALLLLRGEGESAWENRRLMKFPHRPTNLSQTVHLPRMLVEYFKDHFGLRTEMIRWQAKAKINWLKSSSSPDVILGKDGWLFYAAEEEVELFSGAKPFTEDEMAQWQSYLEAVRDLAKEHGASFLFIILPEKQAIYPEKMPNGIVRIRTDSRQDQLSEYLRSHSDIRIVDVRPALFEAKRDHEIYYRTDTHWNDFGAFAAYETLVRELGQDFKGMRPGAFSDFDVAPATRDGDLSGILGLRGALTENVLMLRPKQPPRARFEGYCRDRGQCTSEIQDVWLPRVVVYRDSFYSYLIPYFAEHFSRGVYVWDIKWRVSPELIGSERPNVVVLEMMERFLMLPPPEKPSLSLGSSSSGATESGTPGKAGAKAWKQ